MIETALLQLDTGLEEVARVSGAGSATVLRRVIFPSSGPPCRGPGCGCSPTRWENSPSRCCCPAPTTAPSSCCCGT
ncbi:hypothetical protein NKH77_05380 [Streptomyces sp. M19]